MKVLRLLLFVLAIGVVGISFQSCDGGVCEDVDCGNGICIEDGDEARCECNEGWTGDDCKEEVVDDSDLATLEVVVTNKATGRVLNNDGCLLVLGKDQFSMRGFQYEVRQSDGKFALKNLNTLESEGSVIAHVYSTPDSGTDPASGKTAGVIKVEDLEDGSYYMHVFNPNGFKYVSEITIPTTGTVVHTAAVEPLSSIKVELSLTSATSVDQVLNGETVMLFGLGSDTLQKVNIKDPSNVPFQPFFQGVTAEQVNENGNIQPAIVFFWDIPTRDYQVIGYSESQFEKNGRQAFRETQGVNQNNLYSIRVCWEGCSN